MDPPPTLNLYSHSDGEYALAIKYKGSRLANKITPIHNMRLQENILQGYIMLFLQ